MGTREKIRQSQNHSLKIRFVSSVALRTGLLSTLWMGAVLVTLAMIAAFFYRDANELNFERLLNAHLYSLIAAVSLSETGALQGVPELGDIRYHDPGSGWYWEALTLEGDAGDALKSPSLLRQTIASPPESELAFGQNFTRLYRATGPLGNTLIIVEIDIVMEAQNQASGQNRLARFRIMGNEAELQASMDDFWAAMRWYLAAFILLSATINALMIVVGMQPLGRIKRALSAVRNGEARHLDVDLPLEIQPMAREMNALIDSQYQMIERFRTQLGNLAHAMKTPLAVIINETEKGEGVEGGIDKSPLILEQAKLMQSQIQHHLQRAQMAAGRGSILTHTTLAPVVERLVRVMEKLCPDKHIHLHYPDQKLTFAGQAQDLEEMMGNLLENAGKWAKSAIWLYVQQMNAPSSHDNGLQLVVEDDGPGLDEEERRQALQRGRRLDESVPGSGLGLSIVADLVSEYGGTFQLERSEHGGLRAVIILP